MKSLLIFLVVSLNALFVFAQVDLIDIANEYTNNGQYSQALSIYHQLETSNTDKLSYFDGYFKVLIKTKNISEAESLLKMVSLEYPQDILLKVDFGYLLYYKGDSVKADKIFNKYIKEMPLDEASVSYLANHFYERELNQYAIDCFLEGRNILRNKHVFALDLINLYTLTNQKNNVLDEILDLVASNQTYLAFAKNTISKNFQTDAEYNLVKTELLKRLQKTPEQVIYADLLAFSFIQQKKFNAALTQLIALDKRLNQNSANIFSIGQLSYQNNDFETASKAFQYIVSKGNNQSYYIDALIQNLQTRKALLEQNNFTKQAIIDLAADYKSITDNYGKNNQTLFAITELANLQSKYVGNPNLAIKLLEDALNISNLSQNQQAQVKLQLANTYVLNNQFWDAKLLLSQIEKQYANEIMGEEAKFRNAKLSYYLGDYKWAKSQLDVLKASTSQFISNDAFDLSFIIQNNLEIDSTGNSLKLLAKADLCLEKNELEESVTILDTLTSNKAYKEIVDYVCLQKGKIYFKQLAFNKAAEEYKKVIQQFKFSLFRDDALYLLANVQENQLKNVQESVKTYQILIDEYPGSPYTNDAREHLRKLKDDGL